ncbi:hypothetical protein Q5P01_021937 [Channa striata]|uniref:Uncharacterized protein n=1 Tax=Channa striata TaxID=64152 RepID=A0AA88J856_CHASR|nr:hypothetical protein Q5P01_021937 [Channa striata]
MQARHSRKTHARGGPAGLLGGDDAAQAPRYEHGSTNPVRYMHEMVALCLATEDYAKLSGHSENCEPLPIRGPGRTRPQERWSEKSLPADASDSEGQKRATGARRGGGGVTSVYPEPREPRSDRILEHHVRWTC